jgi:homoserine O-acetyltransferase
MKAASFLLLIPLFTLGASAQQQQFAELGDLHLSSGGVLRECRLGYRTYGQLNAAKSNAILFPTWAGGTTEQLAGNIGPGKLADSSKYFVIAVDALSNGVSSSPSTSRLQPRQQFPRITLRDMVAAEHELVTRVLRLDHLYAVMGISMGGMQTFQWMVSYPGFLDRAVPIVGSPRLDAYDLVNWQAQIDAIQNDAGFQGGNYAANPARAAEYEFGALMLTTPENYNAKMTRQQALAALDASHKATGGGDANNKIRQAQAMMSLNVAEGFGDSLEAAAKTVQAKVLVVVGRHDHTVTPAPAMAFAKLINAELLVLESDCGHSSPACEESKLVPAVHRFLNQ